MAFHDINTHKNKTDYSLREHILKSLAPSQPMHSHIYINMTKVSMTLI